MASQNKPVGGQKNKGSGAAKTVGSGPNPKVVQQAGATQSGKNKGKNSKGKK